MSYPSREETIRICVGVFCVYLGIYYWDSISHALIVLLQALSPLVLAAVIAYIANIPMRFMEERLARLEAHPALVRMRRPVSLLAGLAILAIIVAVFAGIIAPELLHSVRIFSLKVPAMVSALRKTCADLGVDELFADQLDALSDLRGVQRQLSRFLSNGESSLITSISNAASSTLSICMSAILAIYVLLSKEELGAQVGLLIETYFGSTVHERFSAACKVLDRSFHSFIVGRCLVSLLLGVLCTLGMWLFRMPYAVTIGTVVGVTYIVPVVGGIIGALIGALLVFSISPIKAVGFVFYLLILEQIEANLIFPNVVGQSTGLPAIWVLAAVAVGGELGGIPIVLLSVPLAAALYQLVSDDLARRQQEHEEHDTSHSEG